ncbi:uncharacterized protein GLRG_10764 [Colletotrichum graminicola M1.001]|uniref:Uncharacterized protein n=1 Tax=Colletotrichum graminicola (strain M1.001 / M2 / FGSC 10212) TaxID=645133 RepID=E3QXN2_COLGM|nr:uncharacterized protein GLRG_10764 [Colletotrichum graminicola M1.001]EFQ35620.1 hypothetical protein GLRG_10764 [Colletotrichum graminicola M1.001]
MSTKLGRLEGPGHLTFDVIVTALDLNLWRIFDAVDGGGDILGENLRLAYHPKTP